LATGLLVGLMQCGYLPSESLSLNQSRASLCLCETAATSLLVFYSIWCVNKCLWIS